MCMVAPVEFNGSSNELVPLTQKELAEVSTVISKCSEQLQLPSLPGFPAIRRYFHHVMPIYSKSNVTICITWFPRVIHIGCGYVKYGQGQKGKFYFFHPADFSATSPRLLLADLFVVRKNTLIGRKTGATKNN